MKTTEFIKKIAELLLITEEATADWVEDKKLLHSWYFLVFLMGPAFLFILFTPLIVSFFEELENIALIIRSIRLTIAFAFIFGLILLTCNYYRFSLSKNVKIRLENILLFYGMSIVFWAMAYHSLYIIAPVLFDYGNPAILPSEKIISSWKNLHNFFDFLIFSAFRSLGSDYYKIKFESALGSAIGYFQCLYSFGLISLLVASYVNQQIKKDKD